MPLPFDGTEMANAITMLPFAYLSYHAKSDLQAIFITLMWFCAAVYHALVSLGDRAIGYQYYVFDCVFQIASILVLIEKSRCYAADRTMQSLAATVGYTLLAVVVIMTMCGIAENKKNILHVTLLAHVLHMAYGFFYVCDRTNYYKSLAWLAVAAALFVACDLGCVYMWSLGHIALIFYIAHFWKAVDMFA